MRRAFVVTVAAAALVFAWGAASVAAGPPSIGPGFVRSVIVDGAHGVPGPPAGSDSATDYKVQLHPYLLDLADSLEYTINTTGCSGDCTAAVSAVVGSGGASGWGISAWDVSGLSLTHNDSTSQTNPCTDNPNSVTWQPIGSASTLAYTAPCQDTSTGQIVGFDIVFNSNADWSACADASACVNATAGDYSIAAVAAHEAGHVYGLGHDHGAKDERLTMYFATGANDFGHATLGCGDRLGINALYNAGLNCNTLPGD
jgi:hypothetical protein